MGEHDHTVLTGGHAHVDDVHDDAHDDGRTLASVELGAGAGANDPDGPDIYKNTSVFRLVQGRLLVDTVHVRLRPFHVTAWESMYSNVFSLGGSSAASYTPLVDESNRVIGHLGWADGSDILVPEHTVRNGRQFWSLVQKQRLGELRQWLLQEDERFNRGPFPNSPFRAQRATASPPLPANLCHCGYHPPGMSFDTIFDKARRGPLPESTEDKGVACRNNLIDFVKGGGKASVGRHFQKPGEAWYLDPYPHAIDGTIGSPKKPFSSGYEFLLLVDPEGTLQGVMEIRNNLKTEDEWVIETALKVVDTAMTVWMVLDVVPIAVVLLRMGVKMATGATIRAIRLVLDAAAKAALKRLLERAAEEAFAKVAVKLGKLSADEMIAYLSGIVRQHPELTQLMAARVLTEQRLTSATLEILGDWARANGRRILWKTEAEMLEVTKPDNLMIRLGNEFWINGDAEVLKEAQQFYKEVVHELISDSLGYRGEGVADRFIQMPNGVMFTDQTLLENAVLRGDIEGVVRFFAGG